MNSFLETALRKCENIRQAGYSIDTHIEIGDPLYWFTSSELTSLLNQELVGVSFTGLKIRTRSKVAKSLICTALGYPVPKSFTKSKPRFLGQCFNTAVQKANNVQVYNEELNPTTRYVFIRIDEKDIVTKVKVITGTDLALLDTTGTITQKFQARLVPDNVLELVSSTDTSALARILSKTKGANLFKESPTSSPSTATLMSILTIFDLLKVLVGCTFTDAGADQERNRGAGLHKIVCIALGYPNHKDDGRFPDVRHQLLEVKLQTSPTIDLGLVCPDSTAVLDLEKIEDINVRHCDVRYAVFYGETNGKTVTIKNLYLTTGEQFFAKFKKFGGKVSNKKLQIPLPKNFFLDE